MITTTKLRAETEAIPFGNLCDNNVHTWIRKQIDNKKIKVLIDIFILDETFHQYNMVDQWTCWDNVWVLQSYLYSYSEQIDKVYRI